MTTLYDDDTFEHEGLTFKVNFVDDCDSGPPWDEADGHGPVREVQYDWNSGHISKCPGERILNRNPSRRDCVYAYDWAEAMKLAKQDGWGPGEEWEKAHPNATKGEKLLGAVQSDFDFLAGWVNDDWRYVGVIVKLMVEDDDGDFVEYDGGEFDHEDSLWGGEGTDEYRTEVAHELAGEIIHNFERALGDDLLSEMAAAREALEVRRWEGRDVVTR